MNVQTLVVGQGLAGSLLARRLSDSGTVAVVDPGQSNASLVAAGLMTPLTGRRFRLTAEYPKLFARAREAYTAHSVFHPIVVYRMFADVEQRAEGLRRCAEADCAPFVKEVTDDAGRLSQDLTDTHGGVLMHGAWVDLPRFLTDTKTWLGERLIKDQLNASDVTDTPTGIRWKNITAERIVWCDGWRAMLSGGLFSNLTWQPAKGESLDIISDAPAKDFVLNREGWALPCGEGRWRTGTNWDWEEQGEQVTDIQRKKLLTRFQGYFHQPITTTVTTQAAGTRPCTRDNRPYVGQHALHTRHYILNGLGPRGTVWAPTAVDHLEALLENGVPVPAELDYRRAMVS